jgi:hypothetical protein
VEKGSERFGEKRSLQKDKMEIERERERNEVLLVKQETLVRESCKFKLLREEGKQNKAE